MKYIAHHLSQLNTRLVYIRHQTEKSVTLAFLESTQLTEYSVLNSVGGYTWEREGT